MPATPMHPFALLDLDSLLSDEERMIRDTVRQMGDDRLRPNIAEWFESGQIPARELAQELGAHDCDSSDAATKPWATQRARVAQWLFRAKAK